MIITFSVQNYRSIRDKVTLDFRATPATEFSEHYIRSFPELRLKLVKMAMLYGKNASGKTNILRALDFLRWFIVAREANKDRPTSVEPFALDSEKETTFEIKFIFNGIVYLYYLVINRTLILRESLHHWPKGKKAIVFNRILKEPKKTEYTYQWAGAETTTTLQEKLELTIPNLSVLSSLRSVNYSGPMQNAYDWFKSSLAEIVKPDTELVPWNLRNFFRPIDRSKNINFYISQMQKADFMIDAIEIKDEEVPISEVPSNVMNRIIAQITQNQNEPLRIDKLHTLSVKFNHKVSDGYFTLGHPDESAGTQRFFELCGFLCWLQSENKIIPIDEIERALHEDLIKHFIATFLVNSDQSQLIVTSHNSSLLNMRDIIRRDTIWITDRNPGGGTELTRLSDYQVRIEHSIGNLYRKGLIGGKPNIGTVTENAGNEK